MMNEQSHYRFVVDGKAVTSAGTMTRAGVFVSLDGFDCHPLSIT